MTSTIMESRSVHKWHLIIGIVIVLNILKLDVEGHVALTYPPARKFDLDFLDNSRTKPPCGMPKGESF